MKITIELTDNGAKVNIPVGGNNDYAKKMVYEFDRDEHTDIKGYVNMLWDITEAVMLFGKYSQQRVSIGIKHGDGHNCENKKCEICGGE